MSKPTTIKINDVEYVRADHATKEADSENGLQYRIVRSARAGVFAGYIKSQEGQTVEMVNARRIWYWDGAASLSQLAIDGTTKPENCKFPAPVSVTLFEVIEILEVTRKAQISITGVSIWKK